MVLYIIYIIMIMFNYSIFVLQKDTTTIDSDLIKLRDTKRCLQSDDLCFLLQNDSSLMCRMHNIIKNNPPPSLTVDTLCPVRH